MGLFTLGVMLQGGRKSNNRIRVVFFVVLVCVNFICKYRDDSTEWRNSYTFAALKDDDSVVYGLQVRKGLVSLLLHSIHLQY